MMTFFRNWIEQIAISVVIVSIFELIIPNGNIKKYIKIVLGVYVIYCMIVPIANNQKNLKLKDMELKNIIKNEKLQTGSDEDSIDKNLEKLYIRELEKKINSKIDELGYKISKCKIDANLQKNSENPGIHNIKLAIKKSQNINVEKIQIIDNNNSVDNNEKVKKIKAEIANYLEIDEENVEIKILT